MDSLRYSILATIAVSGGSPTNQNLQPFKGDAVMSRRSWNRREFSVSPNGFFTVLRPDRWFSAMRLPGVSRYLADQPKGTASTQADQNSTENPAATQPTPSGPDHAGSQEAAILSRSMVPSTHDRRVMLIVLAVTAITLILLCWHDSRERTASSPPLPSREDHQSTGNCPAAQGIPR